MLRIQKTAHLILWVQQAKELLVAVYSKKGDDFEEANLDNLRVNKFLDNRFTGY